MPSAGGYSKSPPSEDCPSTSPPEKCSEMLIARGIHHENCVTPDYRSRVINYL